MSIIIMNNKITENTYLHFEGIGINNEDGFCLLKDEKHREEVMVEAYELWVDFELELKDESLREFFKKNKDILGSKYQEYMECNGGIEVYNYLEELYKNVEKEIKKLIEDYKPPMEMNGKKYDFKEYSKWVIVKGI